MFDDMKTKGALKKINEGGTAQLSKSQIVLSLVNLNAVFAPMKRDDFKKMPKEDKKKLYDALREEGRVPVAKVIAALKELFDKLGEQGKN